MATPVTLVDDTQPSGKALGSAANPLFTSPAAPGTNSATKAEDSAHVSGDIGNFILAVRTPTVAVAITSTDGDYSPIAVNQYGNPKVDLVDSTGTELTYNANGRAADAASTPVALSNEDVAILGIITETAPATDTASSGLNGRLQRIAQRLTSLLAVFSNSFSNITTATTTTVKSGAGTLHTITINSLGTVASSVVVYDNTAGSGTKIATINSLSVLGTLTFDVAFATGLTLVTTGTVAPDVTVSYR